MKRIMYFIIPLLILSIHTGYVYKLNKINESKIYEIEEKLYKLPQFKNYMNDLKLVNNMRGDYQQSQTYTYSIVGNGNENFFEMNEKSERYDVLTYMSFATERILKGTKVVCGRKRYCEITDIKLIDPETKATYKYKFPEYIK